jgi:cysteine synthase A
MPDNQSPEKASLLRTLGAEVRIVKSVPYSDPNHYQKAAARVAEETPGAVWGNQFDNTANRDTHETTTGPEIWEQTAGTISAFVCATGTGGTLGGVSRYLKSRNAAVKCVLADPMGSALYQWVKTGTSIRVPAVTGGSALAASRRSQARRSTMQCVSRTYLRTVRPLKRGLFLGGTNGVNVGRGARRARSRPGHTIVTVLCDGGAVPRGSTTPGLGSKGLRAARDREDQADLRTRAPASAKQCARVEGRVTGDTYKT